MYKKIVEEMRLNDFTYNTQGGEVDTEEEIVTTDYWADGCGPKNFNPTFKEVGKTKIVSTPFRDWMVDIHIKGVDHSGYLVGKVTRIWKEESFHPENFE